MFIRPMTQTWTLVITSILFVKGTTIVFSILGYMIIMLWICKKSFFFAIFIIINVHPWKETNLDSHNNLYFFLMGTQSCSSHWDTRYWCFRFTRITFFSTIFLIMKVHLWNETNLDAHNNLHSLCYWHYNHALLIGIHDNDALDL